jgi:hypothetical protein
VVLIDDLGSVRVLELAPFTGEIERLDETGDV